MSYAAYLRIYEPVAAFHEPGRSRWAVYAASSARPRRRDSLAAEQAEAGAVRPSAPQTASLTRALLYTTSMSRARRRVARGLAALRGLPRGFVGATWDPARAETELAEVGRWLEDFHPYSLVELDYGGLVQLLSDDALSRDQSVAEIAAAIDGVAKGERELAVAMYRRAHSRWRAFAEYEMAN